MDGFCTSGQRLRLTQSCTFPSEWVTCSSYQQFQEVSFIMILTFHPVRSDMSISSSDESPRSMLSGKSPRSGDMSISSSDESPRSMLSGKSPRSGVLVTAMHHAKSTNLCFVWFCFCCLCVVVLFVCCCFVLLFEGRGWFAFIVSPNAKCLFKGDNNYSVC